MREHGDLSENAEYHAAKERQGMVEARIKDIEDKLGRAEIIDPSRLSGDKVSFSATVDLQYRYRRSGHVPDSRCRRGERDRGAHLDLAPLARALIGKQVGDEVRVKLPAGERCYEIVDIKFA
jgi:transcription elongation factor GreA